MGGSGKWTTSMTFQNAYMANIECLSFGNEYIGFFVQESLSLGLLAGGFHRLAPLEKLHNISSKCTLSPTPDIHVSVMCVECYNYAPSFVSEEKQLNLG